MIFQKKMIKFDISGFRPAGISTRNTFCIKNLFAWCSRNELGKYVCCHIRQRYVPFSTAMHTYLLCRNRIVLVHYLRSWRRYLVYVLLWCYVLKMGQGRAGNSNKVYSRKSLYHIKPVLIGDGSIDTSNQILKMIKSFSTNISSFFRRTILVN